jgi:aryl-alcohol dehydrogenase (NADP+)
MPVQYVNLGRSGLKVSRICMGMMNYGDPNWRAWTLSEDETRPFIRRALELGINFFDTADMYSRGRSEEVTGRLLRELARREEVVIATKVYMPTGDSPNERGLSRVHIMNAIDASLKRLGVDYIDLYQIHRFDPDTPMEETLDALHDVIKAGKARYIGASSMRAWQFARYLCVAEKHNWTRFISMQNHYNLISREEEREMLPLCRAEGIGVLPWSPLARGFLAGNHRRNGGSTTTRAQNDDRARAYYDRDADYAVQDRVIQLAGQRGAAPAQVALAWVLQQPGITAPVIGASKVEHLDQAVAALDLQLSDEECATLQEMYEPNLWELRNLE